MAVNASVISNFIKSYAQHFWDPKSLSRLQMQAQPEK
jgi:hypothetical protein